MSQDEDQITGMLLEQWKTCVEMADRVSARRFGSNKLYLSLLSGLLVTTPIALRQGEKTTLYPILLTIGLLGISICITWTIHIRSYKQLNALKFQVIHEIEESLPFKCFHREWAILSKEESSKSYRRLSRIEQYVPVLLAVPFLLMMLFAATKLS